jgi:translation initiation factor IF-3
MPVKKEAAHRINELIKATEVRLVGDNVNQGVVPLQEALTVAGALSLDLVAINDTVTPPICRVIDYGKFLYDQRKREKELKAHSKQQEVKEVRFGPTTAENDFQTKVKHAREFLADGDKVKAHVFFRGRAIVHKELGEVLLLRFAQALEDVAKVEALPKLEGKKMFLFLAPRAKK